MNDILDPPDSSLFDHVKHKRHDPLVTLLSPLDEQGYLERSRASSLDFLGSSLSPHTLGRINGSVILSRVRDPQGFA